MIHSKMILFLLFHYPLNIVSICFHNSCEISSGAEVEVFENEAEKFPWLRARIDIILAYFGIYAYNYIYMYDYV